MNNLHIDSQTPQTNFHGARQQAMSAARDHQMRDPTVLSWHSRSAMSPAFEGANPDTWWEKFGAGTGGRMQINVGDEYGFILMDARGYETLGESPLRNLSDGLGHQFVCLTPLIGKASATPNLNACTALDDCATDQS